MLQEQTYVIYTRMDHPTEFTTWKQVAKVIYSSCMVLVQKCTLGFNQICNMLHLSLEVSVLLSNLEESQLEAFSTCGKIDILCLIGLM